MNITNINLHSYCNNHIFLHNFKLPNVSDFWILLAKIMYFFYYISTALMQVSTYTNSCF